MLLPSIMRFLRCCLLLLLLSPSSFVNAQSSYNNDYYNDNNSYDSQSQQQQDYSQDSLYHDYAARQHDKEVGGSNSMVSSWASLAAAAGVGWVCGATFHSRRLRKTLNAKFKQDQKELYQQYYNDVYALQQQNAELVSALETQYGGGTGSRRTK